MRRRPLGGSPISWLSELSCFLIWLPTALGRSAKDLAPNSPPATPVLERREYVLRTGAGKSDLSKLAEAAGVQAEFDAVENHHDKGTPLSEAEKVLAEVRHQVLEGKTAAAQDQQFFCSGRVAQVPSSPIQNKSTTTALITCSRSM